MVVLTGVQTAYRQGLFREKYLRFLSYMDKTALVHSLVMSEKNNSIVKIKIINNEKPIVGAVQKVLNQIIILKSSRAEPITLTFGDIESVNGSSNSFFRKLLQNLSKTLHRCLRWN
jgi:hypothetical protein